MQQFLWNPSSTFLYVMEPLSRQFSTPVVLCFMSLWYHLHLRQRASTLSSLPLYLQSVLSTVVQTFVHRGLCSLCTSLTSLGSLIRRQCFIKHRNWHTYTCRGSSYAVPFMYLLASCVCVSCMLQRPSKVIWCPPPIEHKSVPVRT